ncbi:MAG: ClbS/DfsB family four-helix bundle protein [Candidatus Korobacteraceae bacterium]
MHRQQLLNRLDKVWQDFRQSYAGLSEAELTQPGVTKNWSVKDILAHVSTWEEEALKSLPVVLEGRRPPTYRATYGGIDAFNAKKTEEHCALSLAAVQAKLEQTHRRLVEYIESVPEEQFVRETRFRRRLRLDTYSHYPIHAKAIRKWREQRAAA